MNYKIEHNLGSYTHNDLLEMREECHKETKVWKLLAICGFSLAVVFMIINAVLINLL